jgi:LPS export ABC transporter protein LptC
MFILNKNLLFNFSKIISVVLFVIIINGCKNNLDDIEKLSNHVISNREYAENVEIFYSDSAIVRMKIIAKTMEQSLNKENPKKIFDKGVLVYFYDSNQSQTSTLNARYAEYAENEKLIILRDSIVVKNYKSEKLETEELFWNERTARIYSKKFVKITTPEEIIHGYGFNSNMEFTEWEIDSVSGIFQSNSLLEK